MNAAKVKNTAEINEELRQRDCLQKLTWATRELAEAAIAYAGWQYGDGDARPKPYHCRFCDKWHLARR